MGCPYSIRIHVCPCIQEAAKLTATPWRLGFTECCCFDLTNAFKGYTCLLIDFRNLIKHKSLPVLRCRQITTLQLTEQFVAIIGNARINPITNGRWHDSENTD